MSINVLEEVKAVLSDALQLGPRAQALSRDSQLLGAIPEFDSMAVVSVWNLLQERLEITLPEDELAGDQWASVGSLVDFVAARLDA
jgi:acyl carrier protein